MTQEEKAKSYNKALERAKYFNKHPLNITIDYEIFM